MFGDACNVDLYIGQVIQGLLKLFVVMIVTDSIDVCEVEACYVDRFGCGENLSHEVVVSAMSYKGRLCFHSICVVGGFLVCLDCL